MWPYCVAGVHAPWILRYETILQDIEPPSFALSSHSFAIVVYIVTQPPEKSTVNKPVNFGKENPLLVPAGKRIDMRNEENMHVKRARNLYSFQSIVSWILLVVNLSKKGRSRLIPR